MSVTVSIRNSPFVAEAFYEDEDGGYLFDPFDVQMSNQNAREVLNTIGITELDGSMDATDFLGRVLIALAREPMDPALVPSVENVSGGAKVIFCGRPEGYIINKLMGLKNLAEAAREINEEVVWG